MAKYVKKPVVIEAYQTDKEMIIHTLEGDMKASVGDYIITGVHGEQYPCKPDIFQEIYQPLEDKIQYTHELVDGEMPTLKECLMKGGTHEHVRPRESNLTFGEMLEYLKQGRECYRRGWNGKNQFIVLGTAISYVNPTGYRTNSYHHTMGSKAIVFVGIQGEQVGWLASQADMLSDDWAVKPPTSEYNCCG